MTSAFDVACIRGDGLIQWKGDPAPTPPPVTVTFNVEDGALVVQYIEDDEIKTKIVEDTTGATISVAKGSTISLCCEHTEGSGDIDTDAENVTVNYEGDSSKTVYLVLIDGDTTINY